MSQYSKTTQKPVKKFIWLKLQHDFFNRDEIRIIESQTNGKDYIIFYLKLMLKSINDNGKLLFKDTIPYTPEMLASITNTSIDTVRVAIDAFVKLGLMQVLDDGALFMQEVQKLVGSETIDAERKRIARAKQNTPLKLPRQDKKRTLSGQSAENVTLENRDKSIDIKNNIPPYIPQADKSNRDLGIVSVWLEHIKNLNCNFTEAEISAISEFAKYKAQAGESVTSQQINLTLERLTEHKNTGYDICKMINHSIASGYKAVMTPTKDFLVSGTNPSAAKTGRYPSPEYITPENQVQKIELRNYLERCYLRERSDPRTGVALSPEQQSVFKKHIEFAKVKHISMTEYIYQHEVLTGICLLDQPLDEARTSANLAVA